ncbi:hypothetical protein [Candidatus Palauibacter sp.]|uniref:hypothetical protein n=1 Tax=Candidatus Palauibacter sp. TaxID=3101350 RepID=UPI003CC60488
MPKHALAAAAGSALLALGCTDTMAPETAALDGLQVSASLDVLAARPGWAYVRVGVTLTNPTPQTVNLTLPPEPHSCLLVRTYLDGATGPDNETPGAGCRERALLQPRASTRLRAEPTLAFGPPPHPTTTGGTYIVTVQVLDIRIAGAPPQNSDEVYAGTVRVEWGASP